MSQGKIINIASLICVLAVAFGPAHAQDPVTENPNNLSQIEATTYFESLGWDYQTGSWTNGTPIPSNLGGGAAVAILDGMAYEGHADLPYSSSPNGDPLTDSTVFIFTGFPFNPQYTAPDLHGTHVSGIVGARLNGFGSSGVAPEARLLNYAMFDDNGWVGADEKQVLSSAISYGASVANMSYGPGTPGDFSSSASLDAINSYRNEIVVVKAAGNDGYSLIDESFNSPGKSTPLTNLIIVGSVETSGTIAWYSNTPGNACVVSKGRCKLKLQDIFLVAPGGDAIIVYDQDGNPVSIANDADGYLGGIWSTAATGSNSYYRISGTSMAAPHVAGAVALLHGRWPALKLDPETTRNILFDTAQDLGATGTDGIYGRGLLDVNAAMNPVGDPTIGGGGSTDTGGNTGGRGNGKGKNKSLNSWPVAQTRLRTNRVFAALGKSNTLISMFDDYNRDFPIRLSSLVQPANLQLSSKLEQMLASSEFSDMTFGNHIRFDRQSLASTPFQFADSDSGQRDVVMSFNIAGDNAQIFVGRGNASAFFYQPAVTVGSTGFASSELGGVNPIMGFATGDFFTGLALQENNNWNVALGFTQNRKPDPLFEPTTEYSANAIAAALTYRLSDGMSVNATATRLTEDNGILGSQGTGAFGLGKDNRTHSITSSWDWRTTSDIDLSASYTLAVSRNAPALGTLSLSEDLVTDAFHVAVAKNKAFSENDRLSVSISQPLRPISGRILLVSDLALNEQGIMQTQKTLIPLTPKNREIDFQADYSLSLDRYTDLSAFAYLAINSGHIAGEQDTGIGIRFRRKL